MAEARPNVHRRRFGAALRSLRLAAGLSLEEAADRLGVPGKPALSKIENGKQRVTGLGLTAFLKVYQVDDPDTVAKVKALGALAASPKRTNLLDQYPGAFQVAEFEDYLHLEGMACKAESYLHLVPGLLQTREYATSIVERSKIWRSHHEVRRFVDLRIARQAALTREENPLSVWCILDESALHRVVGGPDVMRAQLQRLLDVTEQHAQTVVQVLPFASGSHAAVDGAFQLMHFPAGPPVAVIEMMTSSVYLEEDEDVELYQDTLDTLRAEALDVQASRRLIRKLIKDCYT